MADVAVASSVDRSPRAQASSHSAAVLGTVTHQVLPLAAAGGSESSDTDLKEPVNHKGP